MYKKANKLTIYKHNISVLNRKYIKINQDNKSND